MDFKDLNKNLRINQKKYSKKNLAEVKLLFDLTFTPSEIAKKLKIDRYEVLRMIERFYTRTEYAERMQENKLKKSERRQNMYNIEEMVANNREILAQIAEKIRNDKGHELSEEQLFYAKILFKNGFMESDGNVTEVGKNALYH